MEKSNLIGNIYQKTLIKTKKEKPQNVRWKR